MVNFLLSIDHFLAEYFYNYFSVNLGQSDFLVLLAKWLIFLIPLLLLLLWFYKKNYQNLLRATFSGLFGWMIINRFISYFFYRPRPFSESLLGKKEFLFLRPDYSFPSDHATFLSGITFSFLLFKEKKLFIIFLAVTILISLSRFLVGVHYLSDILAGWLVGLISAFIVKSIDDLFEKYLYSHIIWVYKMIFRFIE